MALTIFRNGKQTLANTTPVECDVRHLFNERQALSVWLHSAASTSRKIEISTDLGTTYEEVTYALNALNANGTTYQKRATLYAGVTHVRYTGDTPDKYGAV